MNSETWAWARLETDLRARRFDPRACAGSRRSSHTTPSPRAARNAHRPGTGYWFSASFFEYAALAGADEHAPRRRWFGERQKSEDQVGLPKGSRSVRARGKARRFCRSPVHDFFPEVRLRRYLEMRGADAGPRPFLAALPALFTGLLYEHPRSTRPSIS